VLVEPGLLEPPELGIDPIDSSQVEQRQAKHLFPHRIGNSLQRLAAFLAR
jgi:hypothetical protein